MDPLKTIGQKLKGQHDRDAIHIAVMPVIAGEKYLYAGQRLRLAYGTTNTVRSAYADQEAVGVVDPFLPAATNIQEGDQFWMFLFPGTIQSLRHQWVHPTIDNVPQPKNEAERWIRQFADRWNFDY